MRCSSHLPLPTVLLPEWFSSIPQLTGNKDGFSQSLNISLIATFLFFLILFLGQLTPLYNTKQYLCIFSKAPGCRRVGKLRELQGKCCCHWGKKNDLISKYVIRGQIKICLRNLFISLCREQEIPQKRSVHGKV